MFDRAVDDDAAIKERNRIETMARSHQRNVNQLKGLKMAESAAACTVAKLGQLDSKRGSRPAHCLAVAIKQIATQEDQKVLAGALHSGLAGHALQAAITKLDCVRECVRDAELRCAQSEALLSRVAAGYDARPRGGIDDVANAKVNAAVAKYAVHASAVRRIVDRLLRLTRGDAIEIVRCAVVNVRCGSTKKNDDADSVVRDLRFPPGKAVARFVHKVNKNQCADADTLKKMLAHVLEQLAVFCGIELTNRYLAKVCERAVFPLIASAGVKMLAIDHRKFVAFVRGCDVVRGWGAMVLVDKGKALADNDKALWSKLKKVASRDTAGSCVVPRAARLLQQLLYTVVPSDMLEVVFRAIDAIARSAGKVPADALVPLAMHAIAHSGLRALCLQLEYIDVFTTSARDGELAYALATMRVAAEAIAKEGAVRLSDDNDEDDSE